MKIKPSIPKGMRDFSPAQVQKRNYIFNTIREVFEKYGYQPIETPTMEKLETLTGKYGDEGDKLLFRVLDSGDYLANADEEALKNNDTKKFTPSIAGKGLRYDLTIPFARYVVQHQSDITFPFKRYQIQPVWRADRPQRGRYREFYQCDADVVGSDSLLNEVELIQIYDEAFSGLKMQDISIKINNRKVLAGIAEVNGVSEKITSLTIVIDKLDKIGVEKVKQELEERGIAGEVLDKLVSLESKTNNEKLSDLKPYLESSEIGSLGISEMEMVLNFLENVDLNTTDVIFNPTLARGLDYYTGTIFEVKANGVDMGSIGGGGRYDNLTGMFGLEGVSGVGISFGAERIYDVMEELGLFPESTFAGTQVLFVNFGGEAETKAFEYLQLMRAAGIKSELFPSDEKFKKQMRYADNNNIPYVIFIGDEELKAGNLKMKDMKNGEQKPYTVDEVIALLNQP